MPNHIRENLPEELSDLPADLIYATNIPCHEFSYSAEALRSVEARESLKEELRVRCGGMLDQWPGWAGEEVRRTKKQMLNPARGVWRCGDACQLVAMRWRCCPLVAMRGRLPAQSTPVRRSDLMKPGDCGGSGSSSASACICELLSAAIARS